MNTLRKTLLLMLIAALGLVSLVVVGQEESTEGVPNDAPLNDTFEGELVTTTDAFDNQVGHITWGDAAGNVELSIAEVERDGEMTNALQISYDIGGWGGLTHALTDGENWISQDWTDYNALQFYLYGNNTGAQIQVEIFDNRNPDFNNDTAERYFVRIDDDYEGWQQFTIPFDSFQRRTDFQPGGAPNDGFNLDAVSGYAFGFPAGVGAQVAYLDDVTVIKADVDPLMVDDFEQDELFLAQAPDGSDIGYVAWGDTPGNVELRLIDAERAGEDTGALVVDYDVATFGGFSHVFNDGEGWASQDWTDYNAISFWVLGSNSGAEIQFEIFDNRNPEMAGDTAERWFYRFVDDSFSWKLVEIPLVDFQRRTDFQPGGAPDDGLNLNAVSGYAFGVPADSGILILDDMQLIVMDGVEQPEGVQAVVQEAPEAVETVREPVVLPEVEPNPDLLEPIPFAEPVVIADFEDGLDYVVTEDNTAIGFVPWGDSAANTVLGTTLVQPLSRLATPEATDYNTVFRIDYDISAWGGFNHAFTDGEAWTPQDWTNHNALQFWLYGNNTGGVIQVEIFDNINPEATGDSATRFFYQLVDDYDGWRQFTIPFAFFQYRTDFQPAGALDDGFNLDAVSGYAFGFPAGVGAQSAYIDDVHIVVVDDASTVQIGEQEEFVMSVEIDESITWDSRDWTLVWSDEFDEEAGTPINDENWTCEVGGQGWGNEELQFYTQRTENVSHNGEGQLVISAIQEDYEDGTCWYGDCEYTSARCITQDKVEFSHGRVEARIKIPTGQGIWPAFWMLGADFPGTPWPLSGEIDIMENVGNEPNTIHGTIHGPGYSGASGIGNSFTTDEAFTDDFHVYAIDWDPYVIRWYVDGEMYGMVSVNDLPGAVPGATPWVYEKDFFLLMNVATGGRWPGSPDETTQFPQNMLIDYVRVYELAQ